MGSFFYGLLFWIIKNSLKLRKHGPILAVFFMTFIHAIILHGITVPILMDFLSQIDVLYIKKTLEIIEIPIIFFIIISWVFIHIKFFDFPLSTIEKNLSKISAGITKGLYKSQLLNSLRTSIYWKLFNRRMNLLASIIIGTVYIYCEINIWLLLKEEIYRESSMNLSMFYTLVTLAILNPFFLIIGISLVISNFKNSNKFLYAPLFLGSLPMLGIIPLSEYINNEIEISSLANIVFYGFPGAILFWLTLILTGIKHKCVFYSSISILCLFFLLPFAYFYPLNEQEAFRESEVITILIYVLGFMGVAVLLVILIVFFTKFMKKKFMDKNEKDEQETKRFNLAVYLAKNIKDCGFWFNAIFFMVSFFGLIYSIYYMPINSSAIDEGTVIYLSF